MLVLSRRKNESIVIGNIVITVVEIRGDKVRLGIEAPLEVSIHRKEVADEIRARCSGVVEGQQAAQDQPADGGSATNDPEEGEEVGGLDAGGTSATETNGVRDS